MPKINVEFIYIFKIIFYLFIYYYIYLFIYLYMKSFLNDPNAEGFAFENVRFF